MPFPDTIPAAVIELVAGFLLPLLIGTCGGDAQAAKDTALRLLAEHKPHTGEELHLAGTAIGYRIRSLAMVVRSADPSLPPKSEDAALKMACSLTRTTEQALRRLDNLRSAPRGAEATVAAQDNSPPEPTPESSIQVEPAETMAAPAATLAEADAPAPPEACADAASAEHATGTAVEQLEKN